MHNVLRPRQRQFCTPISRHISRSCRYVNRKRRHSGRRLTILRRTKNPHEAAAGEFGVFEPTGPENFPHLGFTGIAIDVAVVRNRVFAWREPQYAG